MQRLQRRAYIRAEVPANRIVRASFWLGSAEAEPTGPSPERPVWSGRITDLSAGGFRMSVAAETAVGTDLGDIVGVRIVFGADGAETVYTDAQVRHIESQSDRAVIGFQFLGLAESAQGRIVLQMIAAKTTEFQKAEEKAESYRQN